MGRKGLNDRESGLLEETDRGASERERKQVST